MVTEWQQPSLMKRAQNFKITTIMTSTLRSYPEGRLSSRQVVLLKESSLLTQGLLQAGDVEYTLPSSLAGPRRCKNQRESNLVIAPVLTHTPEQDKEANTFLK